MRAMTRPVREPLKGTHWKPYRPRSPYDDPAPIETAAPIISPSRCRHLSVRPPQGFPVYDDDMIEPLLTVAGGCAMTGATLALWVHDRRISLQQIFAVLVSITVTVSLFSMIAWAAVAVAAVAPICVTWTFVGTLALLFAVRLYRELRRS